MLNISRQNLYVLLQPNTHYQNILSHFVSHFNPGFQVYLILQERQIMSPHSSVVCISKCIEQEKWVPHWWQLKEIGSFASFCMVWRPNNQHIVLCHNGNFGKQTKAKIDRFLSAVHGGTTSNIPGCLFQSIEQKAFCSFRAETKIAFSCTSGAPERFRKESNGCVSQTETSLKVTSK